MLQVLVLSVLLEQALMLAQLVVQLPVREQQRDRVRQQVAQLVQIQPLALVRRQECLHLPEPQIHRPSVVPLPFSSLSFWRLVSFPSRPFSSLPSSPLPFLLVWVLQAERRVSDLRVPHDDERGPPVRPQWMTTNFLRRYPCRYTK
jgi:hypothetical protein